MEEQRGIGVEDFWDGPGKVAFLKALIFGFFKTGKTFTAVLLAIAAREYFKLTGPIAMFDTEGRAGYVAPMVEQLTGQPLKVRRATSLVELLKWGRWCVEEGVSVGVVDSVTHPYRELCESYLLEKNEALIRRDPYAIPQQSMEGPDWGVVNSTWSHWTDFYVDSPLHIIACGRAGWEYENDFNERGAREAYKSGTKVKGPAEMGYETPLLVEMERIDIVRRATVLGDCFGVLDGMQRDFRSCGTNYRLAADAVRDFFLPHLERITPVAPGSHATVDRETRTTFGLGGATGTEYRREKRAREILIEEIQGDLRRAIPGRGAADDKRRLDILAETFGTTSWTAIGDLSAARLHDGLEVMRAKLARKPEGKADSKTEGKGRRGRKTA